MTGQPDASFFAQVSRELMSAAEEEPTLQAVVDGAVRTVPACDFSSLSLRRRRQQVQTIAATSNLALQCDEVQYELDEGPCLEAVWHEDSCLVQDLAADPRWPEWGPRVAALDVGSVLSIRLATSTETIGALNMYASESQAYDAESVDLALIFSVHALNALSSARLVSGLQTAMQSRHLIGVAQGILVHRYDLTLAQAFEVMRRYSSHGNFKLRDVASYVVEHKTLPESPAAVVADQPIPAP